MAARRKGPGSRGYGSGDRRSDPPAETFQSEEKKTVVTGRGAVLAEPVRFGGKLMRLGGELFWIGRKCNRFSETEPVLPEPDAVSAEIN